MDTLDRKRRFEMIAERIIKWVTIILAIGLAMLLSIYAWSRSRTSQARAFFVNTDKTEVFTPQRPPTKMAIAENRATLIAQNYWREFNYADTERWINDTMALEQLFVDWIAVLNLVPEDRRNDVIPTVISYGDGYLATQVRLFEIANLYLDHPQSPYHNEEMYIPILEAMLNVKGLDMATHERCKYRLEMANCNRPGTVAADFEINDTTIDGKNMHDIDAEFLLIVFSDPECDRCAEIKRMISGSIVLSDYINRKILNVITIEPDEKIEDLYMLSALPSLYLLDRNKTVILKDASFSEVENHIRFL